MYLQSLKLLSCYFSLQGPSTVTLTLFGFGHNTSFPPLTSTSLLLTTPKELIMTRNIQKVNEQQEQFDLSVASSASSDESSHDGSAHKRGPSGLTKLTNAHQGTVFLLLSIPTVPN